MCARLPFLFEQPPQLLRPVRKPEAQALQIRIARSNFGFDGRNLLAAARDSCWLLPARRRDLLEGPTIAIELGFLAAQLLPAQHDDIHVFRI